VMRPRLWVGARVSGTRYLLRLHGVLDGSIACQVLDAGAAAPVLRIHGAPVPVD
jgi:hypothetical protein